MSAELVNIADPAVRLYHRWHKAWHAEWKTQEELDALSSESADLAEELATTPARSIAGVWAKIKIALESGGDLSFPGAYPHDCIKSALADLERLAGGAPGGA